MNRRTFVRTSLAACATAFVPRAFAAEYAPEPFAPFLGLRERFPDPVRVRSVEVLRKGDDTFIRATSTGGDVGVAAGLADRLPKIVSLLKELVIPFFLKRDARDLETLIDDIYLTGSNYKYAGMPFWNAVAHVELALWDLLARRANEPVHALLGRQLRKEVPVYVSRFDRNSSAEAEVAAAARDLERTGATAVKLKVGLRMRNSPEQSRRDRRMVELARKTFGDRAAVFVDANSSYRPEEAVEMGRAFQEHGVGFFEEPCPWEEYDWTKRVADVLEMPVAGGEQDTSLSRWRWMARHRGVDLLQPDLFYNGGLVRTLRVARLAEAAGLKVTPHSPRTGAAAAPMLHFAAVTPNLGSHQEYRPSPELKNGVVPIPSAPGLAPDVSPGRLKGAEAL